ncbi:E3 ubiquitin-protein ligase SINA-like 11 [Oryza brachyantha]|uniref:E3 ubiquitin-protein ligase SINA-like 11 n=1 Tax=Oryza brachyantha TaxID=4533 RepID=UPI001ADB8AC5|nr:E3 ubiquitin-protein ligase SINA-like 11 [Oryza brachyantha]
MAREKRCVPRASDKQQSSSGKKTKEDGETAAAHDKRALTVTVDPAVLECDACFGPLAPPLYQCTRGHITCATCMEETGQGCLWCRSTEATMRCRVMEHFLAAVSVPCSFTHLGCAAMVPYGDREAHEATCVHAPCYCPIRGCSSPYSGVSLLDHLRHNHPEIRRTCVDRGSLSAIMMRGGELARLLCLADDKDRAVAVFLLVVDQCEAPATGRSLWMVRLKAEPPADVKEEEEDESEASSKEEFRYKIMVSGNGGVLSLVGETVPTVGRLTAPYRPTTFLFVPGAMLDSHRHHEGSSLLLFAELN